MKQGTSAVAFAALLAAATVLAPRGAAQQLSVSGTVVDQSGATVEDARVALLDAAGAVLQETTTRAQGGFLFEGVRAGSYRVRAEHAGFKPAEAQVRVGSRPSAVLRLVLRVAELREEVTVIDSARKVGTEAGENLNTVTLERRDLDRLPVFDQDYVATMSRFLDAGAVATGGVTLVVDGVEMPSIPGSASTIKEVKINQNPYSAEYSRPGRGRIEVITNPGSAQYHGVFNFLMRDAHLNARDPFALRRPGEQRRVYEGNVNGPLGRGKTTSFTVSVDREEDDREAVVYALDASGAVRPAVPAPARDTEITPRITRSAGARNVYSIWYVYRDRTTRNQGVGGFVLPEAGANYEFREDEIFYSHRTTFTPKLLNQFRLLVARYDAPTRSLNPGARIVVLDAFTGGGAQADQLRTERHFALHDIVSWSRARHLVTTGLNIPDFSRRGLSDRTNQVGTYTFSTLTDYLAGRPFSLTKQAGNGRLVFVEKVFGGFVQDEMRLRPNLSLTAGLRFDWQNYFHDHDNFSPRLALAWAPGAKARTVLRAGAGIFYDRTGPMPISDLLRFDGHHLNRYVIADPSYPFAHGSLSDLPVSLVRLDPRVRMPYNVQWSAGLERQLAKSTTASVTYVGARGISMFHSRDLNAPPPPAYLERRDPRIGVLRQIEASARTQSDALEVTLRGNLTKRFTGTTHYVLSRAWSDTGGIAAFPADNYDLAGEWGRADFDQRHRFDLLGTLHAGKWFDLGLSAALYSGGPYTITTGRDDNHDALAADRPPGVRRNSRQGPGYADLDLRWTRDVYLRKDKREKGPTLTFGLDAFNALNRVNFLAPVGNLSSPFYGRSVAARPPRRLQALVKLTF